MPSRNGHAGFGPTKFKTRLDRPAEKKPLTPRELEVAEWIGRAKGNEEIATILGCSTLTVKKHVHHILGKLSMESRLAVCSWWHEHGKKNARSANGQTA
ncbi:MAG TPA: helix-turn-helix transcriptional regulator [Chthoniobacterales bacterium]